MLKIYNYLTRKIEIFEPLNSPLVTMYSCGPTVYDYPHIGNLRTYIFADILKRVLELNDKQVKQVMNITDIEDKIIRKAKEKSVSIEEITRPLEKAFFEDLDKLNILHANIYPRATEHITAMIKYIEELIKKGFAYIEEDRSIYFNISKFPEYGKLSQIDKRQLKAGTRVLADEYSKENVQDFALWKSVAANEVGYESPWGKGRPGWHIECSVMSQEYLGETLDLHTGAIDLLFPHHENEIAQSEAKTGKTFSRFFVEAEHLLVNNQKMSKSLGNFYTLRDIEEKNIEPLGFRYLNLTAHYRDRLNFTWESLSGAQKALNNLREEIRAYQSPTNLDKEIWQKFMETANNDLNMPQALAVMWELVHKDISSGVKSATLLQMDKVLGLRLSDYLGKPLEVPESVQKLVDEREKARVSRDFERADHLRKEVEKMGYEIEDTNKDPRIKKL